SIADEDPPLTSRCPMQRLLPLRWMWPIGLCLLLLGGTPPESVAQEAAGADLPTTRPEFDLIIRGGRIVDGSGNPWYHADMAIRADRIVAIGRLPMGVAAEEIDASGLVVA